MSEEWEHHDWKRLETGEIDYFAWGEEYCNGPQCRRCGFTFCRHCEGWDRGTPIPERLSGPCVAYGHMGLP